MGECMHSHALYTQLVLVACALNDQWMACGNLELATRIQRYFGEQAVIHPLTAFSLKCKIHVMLKH